MPTATQNRIAAFKTAASIEIADKGDNLWGLFSGVTRFTTHGIKKGDTDKEKMFGEYGKREQDIFAEFAEIVGT